MSSTKVLLHTLKRVIKSYNISYSEIAKKLDLSETTIKRMLNGQLPLSIDRLNDICSFLDIDLLELAQMAKVGRKQKTYILNSIQEEKLAEDELLFLVFYVVAMGATFEDVLEKIKITEELLFKKLRELEKIEIVEIHPKNKIKFLLYRKVRWNRNGPLDKKYTHSMMQDFLNADFAEKNAFRTFMNHPLSEESKKIALQQINELASKIERQSELDISLNKDNCSELTFMISVRPWELPLYRKYKRN